jgi:hypothetical protein
MNTAWPNLLAWLTRMIAVGVACFSLAFIAFLGFCVWSFETPAVPYHKAERIVPGLSAVEVKNILGPPWWIESQNDGSEQWHYGSEWKWVSFYVDFSPQRKVELADHDW